MKQSIFRACIGALLAVCAFSASAGTLTHNFTDDNGVNFSPKSAYQIEKVAGAVKVVAQNGTTYTYADASGALHTKLLNYMAATGSWYRLPGTLVDMNVSEALNIGCYGSSQTYISYIGGSYTKFVADNCAARAAIAAQSN